MSFCASVREDVDTLLQLRIERRMNNAIQPHKTDMRKNVTDVSKQLDKNPPSSAPRGAGTAATNLIVAVTLPCIGPIVIICRILTAPMS